jgi:hypothetical protein
MTERAATEWEVCCKMVGTTAKRWDAAMIAETDVSGVFVGQFFVDWQHPLLRLSRMKNLLRHLLHHLLVILCLDLVGSLLRSSCLNGGELEGLGSIWIGCLTQLRWMDLCFGEAS